MLAVARQVQLPLDALKGAFADFIKAIRPQIISNALNGSRQVSREPRNNKTFYPSHIADSIRELVAFMMCLNALFSAFDGNPVHEAPEEGHHGGWMLASMSQLPLSQGA